MSKLPSVVSQIPNDLRQFLERVREALSGKGPDRLVSAKELVGAGIAKDVGGSLKPAKPTNCNTPPAPTNLVATGALANIVLTWDKPVYPCHAYAEILAAEVDDVGQASVVGMTSGNLFAHNIGGGASRYYWVRYVNTEDTRGGYNAIAGTHGQTGTNPSYLMTVLAKEYGDTSEAPFFQIDQATEINGVTIPAGTYMKSAFIHEAMINSAMIAKLAVDNSHIANLNAVKINAGYLSADRIEAGSLNADKIAVNTIAAHFANVDTAYVNNQHIGDFIQSTGYESGAGWRIDKNGTITSRGENQQVGNESSYDYTQLTYGNVVNYAWLPGAGWQQQRALMRVEFGDGINGNDVYLNGYWKEAPRIIVSPKNLQLYNASASNANQEIQCSYADLLRLSADPNNANYYKFKFTPVARISVSGSGGYTPMLGSQTLVNQTLSPIVAESAPRYGGTWNSSSFTIPLYTTQGTISLSYAATDVTDVDHGKEEADGWLGYVYISVYVNGSVAWSSGAIAAGAGDNINTFYTGALPAGTGFIQVQISGYHTYYNNKHFVYSGLYNLAKKMAIINSFNIYSSGGNYLAVGSLNWIAIGR